jgi:hypothetical protein
MAYKVKWTQWFYDNQGDKDFNDMCLEFETLEKAESFKADLLADVHRGCTDLRVLEASIGPI